MREVGALLDAHAVHGGRRAYGHLLCLARSNAIPRWRVDEVLQLVGLENVADHRVRTFSLGMFQRLGIAAALLGDPATLILDEPANGLDPEGIQWIRNLTRDLADEGRTVLVSSHLMSEMALTVDHVVIIGMGRLLADTSADALLRPRTAGTVLVRTAGDPAAFASWLADSGATVRFGPGGSLLVSDMGTTEISGLAMARQVVLAELTPQRISLEEVFMDLTRDSVEFGATQGAA
jgi:ABC-2 type transport system ATP-binding protein